MKTITIEDPIEANAMMQAEFPRALTAWASASATGGKLEWTTCVYLGGGVSLSESAPTFAVAFKKLKASAKKKEADPHAGLRQAAAAIGMKLVPAT